MKAIIDREDVSPIIPPGSFVQWIADNVDHNSRTIDGKNTFHGMGIVTSVTPSLSSLSTAIKRSHDSKNIKPLSCSKSIPLRDYHGKALLPAFV